MPFSTMKRLPPTGRSARGRKNNSSEVKTPGAVVSFGNRAREVTKAIIPPKYPHYHLFVHYLEVLTTYWRIALETTMLLGSNFLQSRSGFGMVANRSFTLSKTS